MWRGLGGSSRPEYQLRSKYALTTNEANLFANPRGMRVVNRVLGHYIQHSIVLVRGGPEGSLAKWHVEEKVLSLLDQLNNPPASGRGSR